MSYNVPFIFPGRKDFPLLSQIEQEDHPTIHNLGCHPGMLLT